jgi:hypothetical protein
MSLPSDEEPEENASGALQILHFVSLFKNIFIFNYKKSNSFELRQFV